ncbi:MAG: ABC transporter permease [Clostridia bacterium]|nr:ABC transporter permease [Clostridia bacterium]
MAKNWLTDINDKLLNWYGIVGFLILWQIAPTIGLIDPQFISPPTTIIAYAWTLMETGDLFIHMAASLQRTFLGLFLAVITAVPLGFILGGWFPGVAKFLRPLMSLLGQINAFSLFPIFILFFGIGEVVKISIIYWSSIWPILFTTIAAVQHVEPIFIKSARSMGAGRGTIFFKVILPGSAPAIFTGIRMGTNVAFLMLIAAEMIGASAGLGWLVHNASMNNVIPRLYVATVSIALLGMGLNYFMRWLESTLVTWKEETAVE